MKKAVVIPLILLSCVLIIMAGCQDNSVPASTSQSAQNSSSSEIQQQVDTQPKCASELIKKFCDAIVANDNATQQSCLNDIFAVSYFANDMSIKKIYANKWCWEYINDGGDVNDIRITGYSIDAEEPNGEYGMNYGVIFTIEAGGETLNGHMGVMCKIINEEWTIAFLT